MSPNPNLLDALRAHLQTGEVPESLRETLAGGVRTSTVGTEDSAVPAYQQSPVHSQPVARRTQAPRDRVTASTRRLSIEDLEDQADQRQEESSPAGGAPHLVAGPAHPATPAAGGGAEGPVEVSVVPARITPAGEVEPPLPWQPEEVPWVHRVNFYSGACERCGRGAAERKAAPVCEGQGSAPESREREAQIPHLTTDDTLEADLKASVEATLPSALPAPDPTFEIPVDLEELPLFGYVCGAAGVGKTFWAKEVARRAGDAVVLAATTGIASVNLGEGTTINSMLRFFDTASLREAYTSGFLEASLKKHRALGLQRILLDEVSMMAGEQLTILTRAIDNVNQDKPEGVPDLGLILLGDFAQLAPVPDKDPRDQRGFKKLPVAFAFESAEWERYEAHQFTLKVIRRQADRDFIMALQATRRGAVGEALAYFQGRFEGSTDMHFPGPTIVAKNDAVGKFNQLRLDAVKGAKVGFQSSRWGKVRSEWGAAPKPEHEWGIPGVLQLKEGCRVMILCNKNVGGKDEPPVWAYTNGDLGTFQRATEGGGGAVVTLDRTGTDIVVGMLNRFNEIPLEPGRRKALKAEGHPERVSEDGKREYIGGIVYMPLRLAYATTVHKCCAAGTRVPVLGRGYVPIETLKVGDYTPYGEIRGLAKTDQPAFRVTTKRGYTVVCSANHRWFTRNGCSPTELLTTADAIELQHGVPFGGAGKVSKTLAWVLGMIVGDGCSTDRNEGQIHLACTNAALGDRFLNAAFSIFNIPVAWRKDRRGLYWTSKPTRAKLEALGLDYVKGPAKRIPASIWLEGPDIRAWFLRGLFDADGHIGRNRIILTTASERMGEDVQEMLLTLGIVSKRTGYHGNYKGEPRKYWQVYAGAECFDKFATTVSFFHEDKQKKLLSSRPNRALNPALGFDQVTSVEPLGFTLPMYDLEVPDPHKCAFGPFVGHNSQGLSLDKVQVNIRDPFFAQPGMLYVALSRARSVEGLRLVGTAEGFRARCTINPKLRGYL